jgi:hypothetical protein
MSPGGTACQQCTDCGGEEPARWLMLCLATHSCWCAGHMVRAACLSPEASRHVNGEGHLVCRAHAARHARVLVAMQPVGLRGQNCANLDVARYGRQYGVRSHGGVDCFGCCPAADGGVGLRSRLGVGLGHGFDCWGQPSASLIPAHTRAGVQIMPLPYQRSPVLAPNH